MKILYTNVRAFIDAAKILKLNGYDFSYEEYTEGEYLVTIY